MARTNSTIAGCFKAVMGIKPAEAKTLGDLANWYNTGDISGDYASAAQDVVEQSKQLMDAIKMAHDKQTLSMNAKKMWDELNAWMPLDPQKVTIVDSVDQLPKSIQKSIGGRESIQAFVMADHAYLIADKMDPTNARGVLLHEAGAHMGMENILTMKQYRELGEQIVEWAAAKEGSTERAVSQAAIDRVARSKETDPLRVRTELIAYFVEEAVKAGVEPSAGAPKNSIARWLSDVVSAFRRAFDKLNLGKAAELTAQDVVDMAYGAANLEMQRDNEAAPKATTAANKAADTLQPSIAPAVKAEASAASKASDELIAKLHAALPAPAQRSFTNLGEAVKKFLPAWLTNHQLYQQFGSALPSLKEHVGVQQAMTNMRNELQQRAHEIAVRWDKLPRAVKATLDRVMYDATMQRIDPAEKFGEGVNAHLKPADKAKYDALKARYDALGQGKEIYTAARDEYRKQWNDRFMAYNDTVNSTYSDMMAQAMADGDTTKWQELKGEADNLIKEHGKIVAELDKGPYFPLMRFGEHLAIGKSEEFVALEKKIAASTGETRRDAEAELERRKRDPSHYVVSAHENKADAKTAEIKYRDMGGEAYQTLTDQYLSGITRTSQHYLATLIEHSTAGMDGPNAASVKQALTAMYMQSLPEMHALRREAQRKGIEGASTDMLRAFAASSETNAFYSSRLKYGKDLSVTLFAMKDQAKRNTDLQHIHREMEKRLALSMTYTRTPVQDAISATTWLYQLGVSPASLMMNMTQPWLVSVPVLAGRYGGGAAFNAVRKATVDAARIIRDARVKNENGVKKWDWWSGISENSVDDSPERKMIRDLLKSGVLSDGAQNDNAALASGGNINFHKFNRATSWAMQQVEMMNRLSTALATFRLEMARSGGNYDASLKAAYDTTLDTQMDYTADGSARIMREGGGVPLAKLVFQFRRFQQGMLYLLVHNARKAFAGDKEARSSLAYLMAASGLAAGATGLPFAGVAFAAANLLMDKDDPEGDAETHLRNWLFDATGDRATATVLAKGIPAAFGIDMSKRIGLGDVAAIFPMSKFENKTGKEDVKEALYNAVGPAAGMASRIWGGAMQFEAGNWGKAAESMLPKAAGDVFKATRYATQGMTDSKGHPTGTDLDALDVAYRALGIAPTAESNYYEGTMAMKNTEAAVKERMGQLGEKYRSSLRTDDMADVRLEIQKFNADHPEHPITGKVESQWRKDERHDKSQRAPGSGIKMGKGREASYNHVGRFAQ